MASTNTNDFELIVPKRAQNAAVHLGSDITIPCELSPRAKVVAMEIKWFKDTDCVCLYKNGQVTEGERYLHRVSLLITELNRGNVSLTLQDFRESDLGDYLCQVINGNRTKEITVKVEKTKRSLYGRITAGAFAAGLLLIPGVGLAVAAAGAAGAIVAAGGAVAAAAAGGAAAAPEDITFIQKNRTWSDLERQKMVTSVMLTVQVRRNSIEGRRPHMSGETSNPESLVLVPGSELRLVLLGSAGSEKSAAGNIILGRKKKSQTDTSTATQQSESRQGEVDGKQVTVVETPDWFCSGLSLEEVREDVGLCVLLSAPGPHAFLLVIPVQQSTGVEREMLEKMEEIFGERCWKNTMILFTATDEEQEKNIVEFVQSGNHGVQRLVEKCENRFYCLNIHQRGDGCKVSELLQEIEKMAKGTTGSFYSSETYLEYESLIRAIERKLMREREERERLSKLLEQKNKEIQSLKQKV